MFLDKDRHDTFLTAATEATSFHTSTEKSVRPPLAMGSYLIKPADADSLAWRDYTKYIEEAAELRFALSTLNLQVGGNPNLRGFANMIDRLKLVPDRLAQVQIVNAYINMMDFDAETSDKAEKNTEHPSLLQAILTNKTLCTSASCLKLFALMELGFDAADVHWTAEVVYRTFQADNKSFQEDEVGHAVALVRINDKIWTMNVDVPNLEPGLISHDQAEMLATRASLCETDLTHMNFSGESRWARRITKYSVPSFAFSADAPLDYDVKVPLADLSNVPKILLNAKAETISLSPEELKKYDVLAILSPVIRNNYQIVSDELATAKKRQINSSKNPERSDGKQMQQQTVTPALIPA